MLKHIRSFVDRYVLRRSDSVRQAISELIQEAPKAESSLNDEERILLSNTLRLRDVTVDDVMIPRADIVAIPHDVNLEALSALIANSPFTRFPVYLQDMDDVLGFLHVKDIAHLSRTESFDVRHVLQKVLFVPPSMRLLDLLLQMRATQIPMALVVDEYGGIDGLVTAWDLIREILGDLQDDHTPQISAQLTKVNGSTYIMDARLLIEDLEDEIGPLLTKQERAEDIDTVGGLIMAIVGRVPSRKEIVQHASGATFEILDASPRRITRVKLVLKGS